VVALGTGVQNAVLVAHRVCLIDDDIDDKKREKDVEPVEDKFFYCFESFTVIAFTIMYNY